MKTILVISYNIWYNIYHHYMNEKKTLFKVIKLIILEPLIREVLKFESPAAYAYFMKCSDTHKAYQALEVFLIGTALEMIQMYLNNSAHRIISINLSPSIQLRLGNYCSKVLVTEIMIIKLTLQEGIVSWKCFMDLIIQFIKILITGTY